MILLNNDEYLKWINDNVNLTNCQKKMLINYKNNLNSIYVGCKSNKQFYTLINYCWKNNLIIRQAKIKTLFYSFFDKDFTNLLIKNILNQQLSDLDLIDFIINQTKNKKNHPQRYNTKVICNNWIYIIENLTLIFNNKFLNYLDNDKIIYLDVGCGSGNKTKKFAHILNVQKNNIYGADISVWGPYNQKKYNHEFNFIKIEDNMIDMESNSINFCTCILMLHHVKNLEDLLKEIKRILKPNGILLIIEHNNFDDLDNLTLDILHCMYGYLFDKNNRYLEKPDWAEYHNSFEWNYILEKINFKLLESNPLFTELSNDIRYDNVFYSFFVKL